MIFHFAQDVRHNLYLFVVLMSFLMIVRTVAEYWCIWVLLEKSAVQCMQQNCSRTTNWCETYSCFARTTSNTCDSEVSVCFYLQTILKERVLCVSFISCKFLNLVNQMFILRSAYIFARSCSYNMVLASIRLELLLIEFCVYFVSKYSFFDQH